MRKNLFIFIALSFVIISCDNKNKGSDLMDSINKLRANIEQQEEESESESESVPASDPASNTDYYPSPYQEQSPYAEPTPSPQPYSQPCRVCNATGRCRVCDGSGQTHTKRVYDYNLNCYDLEYESCNTCGGSGICNACHGDGSYDEGTDF